MVTVSGVLLSCRRESLAVVGAAVRAMRGVEVHHADPAGRLVLTIEAPTTDGCADQLRAIQGLPDVLSAEMALHVFEDERHP
jgi:nitrate reductase NapD